MRVMYAVWFTVNVVQLYGVVLCCIVHGVMVFGVTGRFTLFKDCITLKYIQCNEIVPVNLRLLCFKPCHCPFHLRTLNLIKTNETNTRNNNEIKLDLL